MPLHDELDRGPVLVPGPFDRRSVVQCIQFRCREC
jgi:hypothetical protein